MSPWERGVQDVTDRLAISEKLERGPSLTSRNGAYNLTLQDDGNLVLYSGDDAVWSTSTNGQDAERLEEKIRSNEFTLEDFRDQLKTIRKMGPIEQIMGMLPGMGQLKALADNKPDEKQIDRVEAIIGSMTPEERRKQHIINGSRRKRIAKGSGTSVEEVNRLLKQFVQMQKMLKSLGGMAGLSGGGGKASRRRAMQMLRNSR